jgi:hypothetical protein
MSNPDSKEFAFNLSIPPSWVLLCQSKDQLPGFLSDPSAIAFTFVLLAAATLFHSISHFQRPLKTGLPVE